MGIAKRRLGLAGEKVTFDFNGPEMFVPARERPGLLAQDEAVIRRALFAVVVTALAFAPASAVLAQATDARAESCEQILGRVDEHRTRITKGLDACQKDAAIDIDDLRRKLADAERALAAERAAHGATAAKLKALEKPAAEKPAEKTP